MRFSITPKTPKVMGDIASKNINRPFSLLVCQIVTTRATINANKIAKIMLMSNYFMVF